MRCVGLLKRRFLTDAPRWPRSRVRHERAASTDDKRLFMVLAREYVEAAKARNTGLFVALSLELHALSAKVPKAMRGLPWRMLERRVGAGR